MSTRISLAASIAAGVFLPALAFAGQGGVQFDFARVVSSAPVIRHVTVKTPYQECWQEEQYTNVPPPQPANPGGAALAGGLIGGLIGHQFGSGDGNIYATVAGALIGSSIGRSGAEQKNAAAAGYSAPQVTTVERCETRYNYSEQERIEGYDVRYEYRGQTYETRMSAPPGKRIKVRVVVTPVASH